MGDPIRRSSGSCAALATESQIDAGLVDELQLIVYPLVAGADKLLFGKVEHRRRLELRKVGQLSEGRLSLVFGVG